MLSFKSALAIIVVPGTACILIPYYILTANRISLTPAFGFLQLIASVFAAIGLSLMVWVGGVFVQRGKGTPIPIEPPTHLVISGLYRYVRNPMYVGALLITLAEAVYFRTLWMLLYTAGLWALLHIALVIFEEPQLKRRFGGEYEQYLADVPRWIPRLRLFG